MKNKVNEIINDSSTKENDLEFAKKREMATDSVLKEYREFHDNKIKEENQELEKNIIKTLLLGTVVINYLQRKEVY